MAERSQEVIAYDPTQFPELLDTDPAAVQARLAGRLFRAGSIDELFSALEGTTSQALVGRTVEIRNVQWAPFESDSGIIPLAVCDAVDSDTGEVLEFATTGGALVAFLRRAQLIDALPFRARIAARRTRSGRDALNFERP